MTELDMCVLFDGAIIVAMPRQPVPRFKMNDINS